MALAFTGTFLLAALVVHLLYLASVFDIYFTSPLLQGIVGKDIILNGLAQRVVIIVFDGLSAGKAFPPDFTTLDTSSSLLLIPNLRHKIIVEEASWGVAHTHVPTESRVGHVAMIAGFYEDVAAITKGWKENPVEFDHLFNQSRHTWAFGAADIINIFQKGVASKRMTSDTYPVHLIDFADANPSLLDVWVHDRVINFFDTAKSNEALNKDLRQNQLVFFVHLVATDTMGHNKKPDSLEYLETVRVADSVAANISRAIDAFYNDDRTAYLITSDHGMTAWGTHGAGHVSETHCPLVAWGAGVQKSSRLVAHSLEAGHDGRKDIEQVDIPVLLSTLLGTPIPVHSIGRLPIGYLNASDEFKAKAMLRNAVQMLNQYEAHESNARSSTYMFKPFAPLNEVTGSSYVHAIERMISKGNFLLAVNASQQCMDLAFRGIQYYHQYHRLSLSVAVNIGFAGWMVLLFLRLLQRHTDLLKVSCVEAKQYDVRWIRSRKFKLAYFFFILCLTIFQYQWSTRLTHVAYTIFPVVVLLFVLDEHVALRKLKTLVSGISISRLLFLSIAPLSGIALLTAAFFHREALSVFALGFCFMHWLPFLTQMLRAYPGSRTVMVAWTLSLLLMGAFPLLPVVSGKENYLLVFLGGFVVTTTAATASALIKDTHSSIMAGLAAGAFGCVLLKMHTVVSISQGHGLPFANQVLSWLSLPALPGIALMSDPTSPMRLLALSVSLCGVYVLTAVTYEALFVVALCFALATWILYENCSAETWRTGQCASANQRDNSRLSWRDVCIAFAFVFFIMISFFGTGNIASVNTFDNSSTYCFQTVLNQWVMAIVLSLKLFIPLGLVCVFFGALQATLRVKDRGLFLLVLLITDAMAAVLFFLVRDKGSWLDIGESLSRFVICLVFVVFLIPVVELSNFVSGRVVLHPPKSHML